jgi:PhoPQ-activated pathogenicity-related protein
MLVNRRSLSFYLVLFALVFAFGGPSAARARKGKKVTALDRYVAKPDSNYSYKITNTIKKEGYTVYVVRMVSQQWRTAAEVDRPIWEHWMTIIQPDEVVSPTGFMFISGGSVNSKEPGVPVPTFTDMAVRTKSVVAELKMIPYEPLTFKDETKSRNEDGIIAYTWEKFMRTGDENWPLRLPMTKAAVRALDTITSVSASSEGGKKTAKVEKFIVSGGSKRGWTTWTTAIVDDRVIAILPFVIDCLNMEKSMEHHYRAYGFWAPSVRDYLNTVTWMGTPQHKKLMEIEDPYSYLDRLTMPKMIINSAGDQFFLPDSSQFYFDDLKGEKHLRYVPNSNHSLDGTDAPQTLDAFYEAMLNGTPRPKYSWKFEKDGSITVTTKDKPTEVKLWNATNPKARDFRLEMIGKAYKSEVLQPVKDGVYVGSAPKPEAGYTAYFVEMTFPNGGKYPFKFTSGVRVTPDVLPHQMPPKQNPAASAGK